MITKSFRALLLLVFLTFFGYAISGDVSTGDDATTAEEATTGDDASTTDDVTTGDDATTGDEASTGDEATTEDEASAGDDATSEDVALAGDKDAGEVRYNKTCKNCHGPAGKGVASYPKISGNDIAYTE